LLISNLDLILTTQSSLWDITIGSGGWKLRCSIILFPTKAQKEQSKSPNATPPSSISKLACPSYSGSQKPAAETDTQRNFFETDQCLPYAPLALLP